MKEEENKEAAYYRKTKNWGIYLHLYVIVISAIISYLFGSLLIWDFDITNWDIWYRLVIVLVTIFVIISIKTILLLIKEGYL
jgi:hypothetical protein